MHFHNPTLGKNGEIIQVVNGIAARGIVVFLQIHDFAEDGRVAVASAEDYPRDVHYGVINSRDYRYLIAAGLNEAGLHLIPNGVRELPRCAPVAAGDNLILYPVRAIRRKNVGEAVLLSLLAQPGDTVGITLPALSAGDQPSYAHWKQFSRNNGLPVEFDLGLHHDFADLAGRAKSFVTTSITEGFGFVFLEPWVCGRGLIGRNLPGVCRDFAGNGMVFNRMYRKVLVPAELIDQEYFLTALSAAMDRAAARFDAPIERDVIMAYWGEQLRQGGVDFGVLSERLQTAVLQQVLANSRARCQLVDANPEFRCPTDRPDEAVLERNRLVIARHYSRTAYTERLNALYADIAGTPVRQAINRSVLLRQFMRPEELSLLKWGDYDL